MKILNFAVIGKKSLKGNFNVVLIQYAKIQLKGAIFNPAINVLIAENSERFNGRFNRRMTHTIRMDE